ncbi:excisionase family DNA-binding protein [Streptomyces sp. NPDC004528]|uniref:excisionase family DNA-binding protein n=1 Tax=Streptomyces sp. NPDC004528 TaxID=3154550 RepID=UPI0033A935D4
MVARRTGTGRHGAPSSACFPRRLIAERRITFVKVGRHVRIPESAVDAYITEHTVKPITVRTSRLKAVA